MRVLFVDDEPNVLAGIRRMLRRYRKRWTMDFAGSGPEALASLEEHPADLVVSDIRMPGMNGVELLGIVRRRWPETLRMVLSGESDREALLRAVGPTHQYLCKPCRPEALVAALERMDAMLQMLDRGALRAAVGRFESLPTPSTTFSEAMAALDDPERTVAQLARIIGSDVGMSTAVLRVANSAYVGLAAPVASVERAVSLLGAELVRAILTVAGVLRSDADHPAVRAVLERGRAVARGIGVKGDGDPAVIQQARLAGMLHNVGMLVFMGDRPDDYAPLLDLGTEERTREECARYGAPQARIGAYLLGVWGLPAPVMRAVAHQDQAPEPGASDAHALLYRALHPEEAA